MAAKWAAPPPERFDLPPCEHPGCGKPAPYGYGCTLRSHGHHFCEAHRPSEPIAIVEDEAARVATDLFAPSLGMKLRKRA